MSNDLPEIPDTIFTKAEVEHFIRKDRIARERYLPAVDAVAGEPVARVRVSGGHWSRGSYFESKTWHIDGLKGIENLPDGALLYATHAGSETTASASVQAMCACGDRPASECDEEWGPNCDLGNNEKHARVSPVDPAVIDAALAAPAVQGVMGAEVVRTPNEAATGGDKEVYEAIAKNYFRDGQLVDHATARMGKKEASE